MTPAPLHAKRFVLCAEGHPLITGTSVGRLGRVLQDARRKLKNSDGTLGGLLNQYHHQIAPDDPERIVGYFVAYWFSDYHLVRREIHNA